SDPGLRDPEARAHRSLVRKSAASGALRARRRTPFPAFGATSLRARPPHVNEVGALSPEPEQRLDSSVRDIPPKENPVGTHPRPAQTRRRPARSDRPDPVPLRGQGAEDRGPEDAPVPDGARPEALRGPQ